MIVTFEAPEESGDFSNQPTVKMVAKTINDGFELGQLSADMVNDGVRVVIDFDPMAPEKMIRFPVQAMIEPGGKPFIFP
jgi:hypothetical protein